MIYTSYYGNMKNLPEEIRCINVARWKPDGVVLPDEPCLYPTPQLLWDFKKGRISPNIYVKRYREEVFGKVDIREVVRKWQQMLKTEQICFVCFERTYSFCHRYCIINAVRGAGYECVEYGADKTLDELMRKWGITE